MRSITAASLAKLSQKTGTEPVCLLGMEWTDGSLGLYSDKDVGVPGVEGRIVQISEFDDVLNITKSGTAQSVTVVLDDTDGAMKDIFNNADAHNRRASIYQWFTGIPISDAFLLFSGVVASPIVWKEGDRTLTLTIITRNSEVEVGFSPEEGQFPNLPEGMVGQVWPLIFGTVMKLPLKRIDEIPHTDSRGDMAAAPSTTSDHGIEDPSLGPHIADLGKQADFAAQLAQVNFIGYLEASFTARKHGELDEFDSIDKGKGTFSSLAKQFLALGNKYLLQAQTIKRRVESLTKVKNAQKKFNVKSIGVTNGQSFKQGVQSSVKIGPGIYTGTFLGNSFQIQDVQHPEFEKYLGIEQVTPGSSDPALYLNRSNFFWNPAGQRLALAVVVGEEANELNNIRYIVAATLQVTVRIVYAYQSVGGSKLLTIVPPNLYAVFQVDFGSLPVTMLILPSALSSLTDSEGKSLGWEDELYATVTSPVGPNTVEIMKWIIGTYTEHAYDLASFAQVEALLAPYPSNFAVQDRPNAVTLLQEIAYQSRCIIWLKNDVFHVRYLSVRDAPTASLSEADILEQSLEVSYTETEDLATKVKASWRPDYETRSPNLVILRYNIGIYGLHEVEKNYFTYNMQQLVEKSAVFWLIRDSNTFKRVALKVPIKFLNIESLDTVTLNFTHNFVADGPVDCVVESAQLNTADYTIALQLWVPVRAGEMTEYRFAYPGGLSIQEYWPTPKDEAQGRAGGGVRVRPNQGVELPRSGDKRVDKPMSGDTGNGGQLHVTKRPLTWGPDPSYFADDGNAVPVVTQRIDDTNTVKAQMAKKPDGTTAYQLYKSQVVDQPVVGTDVTTCFPAKVTGGGPGEGPYTLDAYMQGTDNDPTPVKEAWQLQISEVDTIPVDSWCLANRVAFTGDDKKAVIEWYIQLPVWM